MPPEVDRRDLGSLAVTPSETEARHPPDSNAHGGDKLGCGGAAPRPARVYRYWPVVTRSIWRPPVASSPSESRVRT